MWLADQPLGFPRPAPRPPMGRAPLARLRLLTLGLLTLLAGTTHASGALLDSSLGRWLDSDALPVLGRTLGEHPRFKGETIRVVSLKDGQPTQESSRLHQAIEAHLTQYLLGRPGARLAWVDPTGNPCRLSAPAVYLLGVEIQNDGSRQHRLSIRMIDVEESVWVSGVSHVWRGRLNATETAALRQTVSSAPRGTVSSPLPGHASREIASLLTAQVGCTHPQGLDGPVYLATASEPFLERIRAGLLSELTPSPLMALTDDPASARWTLALRDDQPSRADPVRAVILTLTDQDTHATQQVATVHVRDSAPGPAIARTRPDPAPAPTIGAHLISPLTVHGQPTGGKCRARTARSPRCAEVSLQVHDDAYVFVLSASDRQLSSSNCSAGLIRSRPGERRFRVRLSTDNGSLPAAGVYAIATRDRTVAQAFARHIRSGVCSRPRYDTNGWLEELDSLLSEHAAVVQWRAVHIEKTSLGVASR